MATVACFESEAVIGLLEHRQAALADCGIVAPRVEAELSTWRGLHRANLLAAEKLQLDEHCLALAQAKLDLMGREHKVSSPLSSSLPFSLFPSLTLSRKHCHVLYHLIRAHPSTPPLRFRTSHPRVADTNPVLGVADVSEECRAEPATGVRTTVGTCPRGSGGGG